MSSTLDKFGLTGRTAIVTGGAGLLGREFCRTLAEAGARVAVADLAESSLRAVAEDLRRDGLSALAAPVDVTDARSVESMFTATTGAYGQVDILVNSAALDPKFDGPSRTSHTSSFEDYPMELWKQALDVNLTGMFLCCQAAARRMLSERRGVIVNICSIFGVVAPDQRIYEVPGEQRRYKPAYYSVTKAGVLGLTRYLATYFAGRDIRVNALTPGGVYNDHEEAFVSNYSTRTVLGRMARKDEMNGALLFLASDASAYMTGANLIVDGGWTTW